MAKLVIVESPAKAKTIGKYLGDDYEVTASMGHIRDLPASQLGIDVEHGYAPQYISIKGKEKLIKELKSKAKHADGVLLATDPDREGEAISWHLANILGLDPHEPNRVTFDEITNRIKLIALWVSNHEINIGCVHPLGVIAASNLMSPKGLAYLMSQFNAWLSGKKDLSSTDCACSIFCKYLEAFWRYASKKLTSGIGDFRRLIRKSEGS